MLERFVWTSLLRFQATPSSFQSRQLRREMHWVIAFLACCAAIQPWMEGPARAHSATTTSIQALAWSATGQCVPSGAPAPPGPSWTLWHLLGDPDFFANEEFPAVLDAMVQQYGSGAVMLDWAGLGGVACDDTESVFAALPASTIAAHIGASPFDVCMFDVASPPEGVLMELVTQPVAVPGPSLDLCTSLAYATISGPSGSSGALVVLLEATDPFGMPLSAVMPLEDLTMLRAADAAYLPDFDASLPAEYEQWWAVLAASPSASGGGLCLSQCWQCANLCPGATGLACVNYGPACDAKDDLTLALQELRQTLQDQLNVIAAEFYEQVKDHLWGALFCAAGLLGVAAIANWLAKSGQLIGSAVQRGAKWSQENLDLSELGKLIASLLIKNSNAISIMVQLGAVLAICLAKLATDMVAARKVRAAKEAASWNEYHRLVRQLQQTACGCPSTDAPFTGETACVLASL